MTPDLVLSVAALAAVTVGLLRSQPTGRRIGPRGWPTLSPERPAVRAGSGRPAARPASLAPRPCAARLGRHTRAA